MTIKNKQQSSNFPILSLKKESIGIHNGNSYKICNGARAHQIIKLEHKQKKSIPNKSSNVKDIKDINKTNEKKIPNSAIVNDIFEILVTCHKGHEEVLYDELKNIVSNLSNILITNNGCFLQSNWHGIQIINLYSRIATRVLIKLSSSEIYNENDIRDLSFNINWEDWFSCKKSIRINSSSYMSNIKNLEYCHLLVKDGVCDRFRKIERQRPDVNKKFPDILIYLFLNKNHATIYLDTSGAPLFKRGWREFKIEAPLKENLAAGIIALSDFNSDSEALLDPFCGSGTIIIEAAQKILNIPPGISRNFGFESMKVHNKLDWEYIKNNAIANILDHTDKIIIGSDIDQYAINIANENAKKALVSNNVIFKHEDSYKIKNSYSNKNSFIITNPPYGHRMEINKSEYIDSKIWFRNWSNNIKDQFPNWILSIMSDDNNLPIDLNMKPYKKIPMFNGKIRCNLFIFNVFNKTNN